MRHAQKWRNRGDGQPLRRHPEDRLAGGVAAGIAAWRGFSPTTVRIALAVAAFITAGWAVPLYVLGWLLVPVKGGKPASRPGRSTTRAAWRSPSR